MSHNGEYVNTGAIKQILLSNYAVVSCDALTVYDIIITFSQEIDVIWSRKWTAMTWLFACARYGGFVSSCLRLAPEPLTYETCVVWFGLTTALGMLQYMVLAVFSALRVYALSRRSLWPAGLVFALGMVPIGTAAYGVATEVIEYNPHCHISHGVSAAANVIFALITRISFIAADMLVLFVTWHRTCKTYKLARESNIKTSFSTLLIRDGTFYFFIQLMLNILALLNDIHLFKISDNTISGLFQQAISIIVPRFLLSLRALDASQHASTVGNVSTLRFANSALLMGNIGEPLHVNDTLNDEDDSRHPNMSR